MKIRTDFVTNSSSSSFVVARIRTTSKELIESMEVVRENYYVGYGEYIKSNGVDTIEIKMNEEAFGFNYRQPRNPSDVIAVLLDAINEDGNADHYATLSNGKSLLENSIIDYSIEIGETGSSGEAEYLWDEYIDYISEYYDDEDELDEVIEEAEESGEWVTKTTTYKYKQGNQNASVSTCISGPVEVDYSEKNDDEDDVDAMKARILEEGILTEAELEDMGEDEIMGLYYGAFN